MPPRCSSTATPSAASRWVRALHRARAAGQGAGARWQTRWKLKATHDRGPWFPRFAAPRPTGCSTTVGPNRMPRRIAPWSAVVRRHGVTLDRYHPCTCVWAGLGTQHRLARRRQIRQQHAVAKVGVASALCVELPAMRPAAKLCVRGGIWLTAGHHVPPGRASRVLQTKLVQSQKSDAKKKMCGVIALVCLDLRPHLSRNVSWALQCNKACSREWHHIAPACTKRR